MSQLGALDTKTSLQVMEILKEISKDKLIIMVTHNAELAEKYSSRVIKILDGVITEDSNPIRENEKFEIGNKSKIGRTVMRFWTAFRLSLNNLLTKKGRTILVSFAGSIGIIRYRPGTIYFKWISSICRSYTRGNAYIISTYNNARNNRLNKCTFSYDIWRKR